MLDYGYQMGMGDGLDLSQLSNIDWSQVLKSAGGEVVAQQLQSPEVQDLLKSAGANVAVQTAAQQTQALKDKLSAAAETLGKYKFWIIGGLAVAVGAYIFYRRSK